MTYTLFPSKFEIFSKCFIAEKFIVLVMVGLMLLGGSTVWRIDGSYKHDNIHN